jgi:phosphate transporter
VAPSTRQSIELVDFHSVAASPAKTRGQIGSGHIAFGEDHRETFTNRRGGQTARDQDNREESWEKNQFEVSSRRRPDKGYRLWAEALKLRCRAAQSGNGGAGMKFSHSIQFNAVPDWSAFYIAYDNLKKL